MRKTEKIKKKAFKYYCMGLNSKEIGKLLNISYRTVQNYMTKEKWSAKRKPLNIHFEVAKLYENGYTYNEIGNLLNISRATVYNYLKKTRTFKDKKAKKHGTK